MSISLKTYPAPHEVELSDDYALLVNGTTVAVYQARVSAMPFNQVWPGHQRPLNETELAAFAYWDMSGTAAVEVIPSRAVDGVVIRPLARGIVPAVKDNRISFSIPGPGSYTVELNGTHHALHLFINPVESAMPDLSQSSVLDASVYKGLLTDKNTPDPKNFDVIYFPPGIYEAGRISVRSGQTVYIAGGAVVYGMLEGRHASGIRILGRGILDGSHIPRIGAFGHMRKVQPFGTILLDNCEDVEMSGIVIRDPNVYGLTAVACRRVRIADVKLIGFWRYNSDGIDLLNCSNVTLERCFVRSFDDSIVIKGASDSSGHGDYQIGNRPCRNITVRDCVVWNDWGRALEIGAETYAEEISDIVYRNCDIIHTSHVALDIQNGDHALIQNITYEDIRIEIDDIAPTPVHQRQPTERYQDAGQGSYCPRLLVLTVKKTGYSEAEQRGRISQITLRNVRTFGNKSPKSNIVGYDAEHQVEDVIIENLRIGDQLVTDSVAGGITTGNHVRNVVFKSCENESRTRNIGPAADRNR